MKTSQKFQRKSGFKYWNLVLYNLMVLCLVFAPAPGKSNESTSPSAAIPAVANVNLDDGDTINSNDVKFLGQLAPEVPLEADFNDIVPPEEQIMISLEPNVPAEADFDDAWVVIRYMNTEKGSICCMTNE